MFLCSTAVTLCRDTGTARVKAEVFFVLISDGNVVKPLRQRRYHCEATSSRGFPKEAMSIFVIFPICRKMTFSTNWTRRQVSTFSFLKWNVDIYLSTSCRLVKIEKCDFLKNRKFTIFLIDEENRKFTIFLVDDSVDGLVRGWEIPCLSGVPALAGSVPWFRSKCRFLQMGGSEG